MQQRGRRVLLAPCEWSARSSPTCACISSGHPLDLLPPTAAAGNLDLLKVSLPVKMFEPRSYLQKLTDPWVSCCRCCRHATCCWLQLAWRVL